MKNRKGRKRKNCKAIKNKEKGKIKGKKRRRKNKAHEKKKNVKEEKAKKYLAIQPNQFHLNCDCRAITSTTTSVQSLLLLNFLLNYSIIWTGVIIVES